MIDGKEIIMERAMLVALKLKNETKHVVEEHLDELEMLADTAGAETIIKVIQDRPTPDKAHFVGKGKAEELAELVELNEIVIVIFDADLSPTQVRNLEKLLDVKILDRSGLILDIFASHAKTKQAKKTSVKGKAWIWTQNPSDYTLQLLALSKEQAVKELKGSRIYIETSSRKQYVPTRAFYENNAYKLEAVLEEFYAPADSKCIYVKAL